MDNIYYPSQIFIKPSNASISCKKGNQRTELSLYVWTLINAQ